MGDLKVGTTAISTVKLGSTQIESVYAGTTQIWNNWTAPTVALNGAYASSDAGGWRYVRFTGNGSANITSAGSEDIYYYLIGGGGASNGFSSGGGGAGGSGSGSFSSAVANHSITIGVGASSNGQTGGTTYLGSVVNKAGGQAPATQYSRAGYCPNGYYGGTYATYYIFNSSMRATGGGGGVAGNGSKGRTGNNSCPRWAYGGNGGSGQYIDWGPYGNYFGRGGAGQGYASGYCTSGAFGGGSGGSTYANAGSGGGTYGLEPARNGIVLLKWRLQQGA